MLGDHKNHCWQLQRLVIMHSDVAKPHHIFHPRQQQCFQPATTMKQFENIASVFRDAKAFPSDQMLAHVESGTQARWMLKIAASWRVMSATNVPGSFSYSSRALDTERSMEAALMVSTSSLITSPSGFFEHPSAQRLFKIAPILLSPLHLARLAARAIHLALTDSRLTVLYALTSARPSSVALRFCVSTST